MDNILMSLLTPFFSYRICISRTHYLVAVGKHANVVDTEGPVDIFITVSSDRGLCGGVHSAITKNVKRSIMAQNGEGSIIALGDKTKTQLSREFRKNMKMNFNQLGKNVPTFLEASLITDKILAEKVRWGITCKLVRSLKVVHAN
jgi:F0F1-type ATP synthase gamma subunit